MRNNISLITTLSSWKKEYERKWYNELLRSFGAYYLFREVFLRDSRLAHGFSELTGKKFSKFKEELKEQSIIAEQLLSAHKNKPSPEEIFKDFKHTIFVELSNDLKLKTGEKLANPITSRNM